MPTKEKLVFLSFSLGSACQAPEPYVVPGGAIVFEGGLVLSAENTAPATVVVYGDRIEAVLDTSTPLTGDYTSIDGEGRTLMPGLIDLHTHVWYPGELTLFPANGVTSVRNLFGDDLQLQWRAEIESSERLGPHLYTSGPIVDGANPIWPGSDIVTNTDTAAEVVQAQRDAGYDAIKVYNRLTKQGWLATLEAAAENGLPVVGHVPWSVTYEEVLESSQTTIEHLDGFVDVASHAATPVNIYDAEALLQSISNVDPSQVDALAALAADSNVWNTPTLVVFDRFGTQDEQESWMSADDMRYVHPDRRAVWTNPDFALPNENINALDLYTDALMGFTRALVEADAPVVLGTDSGNAFVNHGFSVHEELELLVEAGLTPQAALDAATSEAAAALGLELEVGKVEPGYRADLLLLEADPRESVSNAQERAGVMIAGRWWTEAELQAELAALAEEYASMAANASAPGAQPCPDHQP